MGFMLYRDIGNLPHACLFYSTPALNSKRECLTSSKVGIAIYQSKALFKAYHRLA